MVTEGYPKGLLFKAINFYYVIYYFKTTVYSVNIPSCQHDTIHLYILFNFTYSFWNSIFIDDHNCLLGVSLDISTICEN